MPYHPILPGLCAFAIACVLWGPAGQAQAAPQQGNETLWAVSVHHELLQIKADTPGSIVQRVRLQGLSQGEQIVGIDYRVSRGVLYALSSTGQLYTVNTDSGQLTPVGSPQREPALQGELFGFDFNPAADRIRVVGASTQNLRLHPETGKLAAHDPDLRYASTDTHRDKQPAVIAAAYTYNAHNEKLTTNYALDRAQGTLVIQGTHENTTPAVSPNEGVLFTVGSLGLGQFSSAAFDIADASNRALAALVTTTSTVTQLYDIDLATGRATLLGTLGSGTPIAGLAIEP